MPESNRMPVVCQLRSAEISFITGSVKGAAGPAEFKERSLMKRVSHSDITPAAASRAIRRTSVFHELRILSLGRVEFTRAHQYRLAGSRSQLSQDVPFLRQITSSAWAHTPYTGPDFPGRWHFECKTNPLLHRKAPVADHKTAWQRPHRSA